MTGADITTTPVLGALDRVWALLRERHPEIPPVVLTIGQGSTVPGTVKRGHFSLNSWASDAAAERASHEVFIAGERLQDGPEGVLATLVHEAAHGLAWARDVRDTSRDCRYHNGKFRAIAEELGLSVEKDPAIGWSLTSLPAGHPYAGEVEILRAALSDAGGVRLTMEQRIMRAMGPPKAPAPAGDDDEGEGDEEGTEAAPGAAQALPKPRRTRVTLSCACEAPRRIQAAPGVLQLGPITCGICGAPFEVQE